MKTLLVFGILFATSVASARTYTTQMTCAYARNLVMRKGAVVLYQAPGVYDRYIANSFHCMPQEAPRSAWVRTADKAQCWVGSICVTDNN